MQSKRKQSRTFEDSEVENFAQVIVQGEAVQGRWTKDEHQRFVEALSIHGKNWKKVEEYVGTRSGAQIRYYFGQKRSHAQKFFNRLEKEFNKQFNGLKSSEIKQIFENKMFHNYSECDQSQKRQRAGSINDISDDDIHSMQIESNQQRLQIKSELEKGQLDLDLPDQSNINNNVQEQISKYKLQQNKLQQKMQDMTDPKSYPDELLKEICDLKKEKDEILAIQQIQNAYQYINEVNEQEKLEEQQSRPATDESFFHFIVAKMQKYLNQKTLNLSDLLQVPKIQEEKDDNQEEVEVQRSRKQSFTFYNDQGEENQQRYQTLKKVKKD